MLLFHGSNSTVEAPDLKHSRLSVDFGRGFYTTPIYQQAEKWGLRFKKNQQPGIINVYAFDKRALNVLNVLKFDEYSEVWLEFVLNARSGKDRSDYDMVIGGIANDKVFNTVELYFNGLIDKNEALKRLKYEKPNLQYCFRTQSALMFLRYKECIYL